MTDIQKRRDAIWAEDLLGRRDDAEFVYNFLIGQYQERTQFNRTGSYVMNVDADWGGGKTFFLDGLAADLEARGHIVARVNAWRDDHADDPYIAIMAAIDRALEPVIEKQSKVATAWQTVVKSGGPIAVKAGGAILKAFARNKLGIDVQELLATVGAEDLVPIAESKEVTEGLKTVGAEVEKLFDTSLEKLIDGFKKTDAAMDNFRAKLEIVVGSIAGDRRPPLFVLVDELDRCRPTYSISLLERVKHLFDVPGVIFVFATNTDQLQHSIGAAYGSSFDSFRYLKRFFERTYIFEEPSTDLFVANFCVELRNTKIRAPFDDEVRALQLGCRAWNFDLRAIKHVLDMVRTVAVAWPHKTQLDLVLLFPLCANFYKTGKVTWNMSEPNASNWVWRRTRQEFRGGPVHNDDFLYLSAYNMAAAAVERLELGRALGRQVNETEMASYVYQTFQPEWNGLPYDGSRPSVQRDLLGLVRNAGRMVTNKRDATSPVPARTVASLASNADD